MCTHAGCPNLTQGGPCDQHRVQRARLYDQARGGTRQERGYDAAWYTWLKGYRQGTDLNSSDPGYIAEILRRNRCASCWRDGKRTITNLEFDHVKPLNVGGQRLDPANVQPLCKPCHNRKTAQERMGHA
jgi:5-methylcytosine-specific restriction enzyme A